MKDLWVAVVGVAGVVFGVLISYLINRNNMVLKFVTEERKKWRSNIRKHMKHLSLAKSREDFWALESKFALLLNPNDNEDQEIIKNLQSLQTLTTTSVEQLNNKALISDLKREVTERVRLLLKHDWERSKFESGKNTFLPYLSSLFIYFTVFSIAMFSLLKISFALNWNIISKMDTFFNWTLILLGWIVVGIGLLIAYFMKWFFNRNKGFAHSLGYPRRFSYNPLNSPFGESPMILESTADQVYLEIKTFTQSLSKNKSYSNMDVFKQVKVCYETIVLRYELKGHKNTLESLLLYIKDQANDTETGSFFSGFAVIISSIALVFSFVTPYLTSFVTNGDMIETFIYLAFMLFVGFSSIKYINKVNENYRYVHQNRIYKLFIMLIEKDL